MDSYTISEIRASDKYEREKLTELLTREGITLDANLDYTAGLFDVQRNLIATGSCFKNTLRCLAVDARHQGEGALNTIVSHLSQYQMDRGHSRLFVYTKRGTSAFFKSLGFYEVASCDEVCFLENRKNGLSSYLNGLSGHKKDDDSAAAVLNCNPFTLGHRYLIERASRENRTLHIFIVSEDASLFSFSDRYKMLKAGCAGLDNVIFHETGSYMISGAIFPSYFLKDRQSVIKAQVNIDIAVFVKIAKALGIKRRYVGEEPFSEVTGLYNDAMIKKLPESGVDCVVVPRKQLGGVAISASQVRAFIRDGELDKIKSLVPESTMDFLRTDEGLLAIQRIKAADSVVHY